MGFVHKQYAIDLSKTKSGVAGHTLVTNSHPSIDVDVWSGQTLTISGVNVHGTASYSQMKVVLSFPDPTVGFVCGERTVQDSKIRMLWKLSLSGEEALWFGMVSAPITRLS